MKKIWHQALLVMFVFVVTIGLFPGISANIETSFPESFMKNWLPILMIVSNEKHFNR